MCYYLQLHCNIGTPKQSTDQVKQGCQGLALPFPLDFDFGCASRICSEQMLPLVLQKTSLKLQQLCFQPYLPYITCMHHAGLWA